MIKRRAIMRSTKSNTVVNNLKYLHNFCWFQTFFLKGSLLFRGINCMVTICCIWPNTVLFKLSNYVSFIIAIFHFNCWEWYIDWLLMQNTLIMKFRDKVIKTTVRGSILTVKCLVDGRGEVWLGVLYEDADTLETLLKRVIEFIHHTGLIRP